MIYEPKVIFNPTEEVREFTCQHKIYKFEPFEKRMLDGWAAHHVLKHVNGPFREYDPAEDDKQVAEGSKIAYDQMSWGDIRKMASKRGLFKPGMTRKETVQAMVEADGIGA